MKNNLLLASLGVALFLKAPCQAQDAKAVVPAQSAAIPGNLKALRLKNVPASLMAYWLDPAHNSRPLNQSPSSVYDLKKLAESNLPGPFVLPATIQQIIPIEPQNVILIEGGNDEDVRRLQAAVNALDQSLRQVELEAQFVEMAPADLESFGIVFPDPKETGGDEPLGANSAQFSFVRHNFTARLNALVANDKAEIIRAPRVTALNKLPAKIGTIFKDKAADNKAPGWNYNLTPTINEDDIITVLFDDLDRPARGKDSFQALANIRDGDTVALLVETKSRATDAISDRVTVMFLTARIIRRANEFQQK